MKTMMMFFVLLSTPDQCSQKSGLQLIKATSQSWSGGAAAMRGTYYNIYFDKAAGADYTFDSLWVNGKRVLIQIKHPISLDTLVLVANDKMGIRMPGTDEDPSKSIEAKFPVQTNAEGLLGYFYKGERKYFPIPAFERLKPLIYP